VTDTPKVSVVRTPGGKTVRTTDLPVGVWETILAETHNESVWWMVTANPLGNLAVARRVWAAALRHAGEDPGETFDQITIDQLADAFDLVDDDQPTVWADGNPPAGADGATAT